MTFRRRHRRAPRNPFSGATGAGERYALSMLGYSVASRREIDVSHVNSPVNETRPQFAVEATGARGTTTGELVFDADSIC